MKIFYFTTMRLPSQNSQSVHVMKMAQAMGKAGHDVTLFAQSIDGASAEDIFKIYDSVPYFNLNLTSYLGLPFISEANQMMRLFRQSAALRKPDLIYGDDISALAYAAPEKTPVIFETHSLPDTPAKKLALKTMLRRGNLKGIVTVCDVLKNAYLQSCPELNAEDIFVAHDGADLIDHLAGGCNKPAVLMGRTNSFHVGYTGSLDPGKGVAMLDRIAKIRPDYDFHILGGTDKQVERLKAENRLRNVYFYGHRDHAEIPSYLSQFDVCVAPYQHRALIKTGRNTSRWISPMKIFEYMAAEKPILCSNLPVMHEILTDRESALFVAASDEEKWAEALDNVRENPAMAAQIARNAYLRLEENYTWDKRVSAIMDFALSERKSVRLSRMA